MVHEGESYILLLCLVLMYFKILSVLFGRDILLCDYYGLFNYFTSDFLFLEGGCRGLASCLTYRLYSPIRESEICKLFFFLEFWSLCAETKEAKEKNKTNRRARSNAS